MTMWLICDNSGTLRYNWGLYYVERGEHLRNYRSDDITIEAIEQLKPTRICISPGPCTPHEAGVSVPVLKHFAGKLPILGVCLGHQSIGAAFGGKVIRAKQVMHGKTSPIEHTGIGVFKDLPSPYTIIRHPSLAIERETLPDSLEVTAGHEDGGNMGGLHKKFLQEGVHVQHQ